MRFALLIALTALLVAPAAFAKTSETQLAKHRYYHADGYIKAIGKNARRTIYHPNPRIRHRWQRDLRYLVKVREQAWRILHPAPVVDYSPWSCIHRYEGAWTSNTGNGYYGGLQMDYGFMRTYGGAYLDRWGTADNWPVWAQIDAAQRAHDSGRGYTPWPNTARACGLL